MVVAVCAIQNEYEYYNIIIFLYIYIYILLAESESQCGPHLEGCVCVCAYQTDNFCSKRLWFCCRLWWIVEQKQVLA